jgi:hypothetical protein
MSIEEVEALDETFETRLSVDDEFKRSHKYINAENFDEVTLIRREEELKTLEKLYPHLPPEWILMAWNYCQRTPKEEQDAIVAQGGFKQQPKERTKGGKSYNMLGVERKPEFIGKDEEECRY